MVKGGIRPLNYNKNEYDKKYNVFADIFVKFDILTIDFYKLLLYNNVVDGRKRILIGLSKIKDYAFAYNNKGG